MNRRNFIKGVAAACAVGVGGVRVVKTCAVSSRELTSENLRRAIADMRRATAKLVKPTQKAAESMEVFGIDASNFCIGDRLTIVSENHTEIVEIFSVKNTDRGVVELGVKRGHA